MHNPTGLNHVTIVTRDKLKAEDFYLSTLGLEKQPAGDALWIRIGQQFIHITETQGDLVLDSQAHFAVSIDGLEEYLSLIKAKGVEVFGEDGVYPQHFIKDPDGNLIEFVDSGDSFFNPPN